jgi:hypothetical protein
LCRRLHTVTSQASMLAAMATAPSLE